MLHEPIQLNRREAAERIRLRLDVSRAFAQKLVAQMGDDHVLAIQQSIRQGLEIGDNVLAEAIYQHRIRAATDERIRNLNALARRRLVNSGPKPGESKTRRRIPADDPLQRKLFR